MTSKSNRLRTIYGRVIALSMLVLLFVSTTGCKQERPAVPMTAGSFNIWCGVIDTGAFPWKTRCEQIAALIRFHDYDIIGMQEVRPEQMADLGKALPEYTAVGTGRDGNGQGEHSPVFSLLSVMHCSIAGPFGYRNVLTPYPLVGMQPITESAHG